MSSLTFDDLESCSKDGKIIAIFILGGPGAGKGTQCTRIASKYWNIITLSTGNLFRQLARSGTPEGNEIARQMAEGKLVNINATEKLLKPKFAEYMRRDKNLKLFLIDGFPRDINILKDWQIGMENDAIVPFIIEFTCETNVLRKRLTSRARADNNPKSIEKRINLFENETQEVINYFKDLNKYKCINANDSVDNVFKSFCKLIDPILNSFYYYRLSKGAIPELWL